jgi:hypothetical protein
MTISPQAAAPPRYRRSAIATGILFLVTHITSIGAVLLYDPVLKNPDFILATGPDNAVLLGTLFDVILALAVTGTAVALYPVVKRWNESVALGYVGLRTLEAAIIAVGVIPLLAVVTLRQMPGAAEIDAASLLLLGQTLVSFYDWTTVLGPGLVVGVNTVLMAYLMYRSRLVPRFIPILGLIGGPLIFVLSSAKLFGGAAQFESLEIFAVIPIFAWELSLALWLLIKGFRSPSSISSYEQSANDDLFVAA